MERWRYFQRVMRCPTCCIRPLRKFSQLLSECYYHHFINFKNPELSAQTQLESRDINLLNRKVCLTIFFPLPTTPALYLCIPLAPTPR